MVFQDIKISKFSGTACPQTPLVKSRFGKVLRLDSLPGIATSQKKIFVILWWRCEFGTIQGGKEYDWFEFRGRELNTCDLFLFSNVAGPPCPASTET